MKFKKLQEIFLINLKAQCITVVLGHTINARGNFGSVWNSHNMNNFLGSISKKILQKNNNQGNNGNNWLTGLIILNGFSRVERQSKIIQNIPALM